MKDKNSSRGKVPSKDEIARMREMHDRMMNDPEQRKLLDRMKAQLHLGSPAYAVLNAPLPGEAAVRIVRDPKAPIPRLIILSLPRVDEVSFTLAQGTLFKSEIDEPEITDTITIDILPDRRTITTRIGADPVLRSIGGHSKPSAHQWREMELLKRLSLRYPAVALGDLGEARTIPARPHRESSIWMQAAGYVALLPWIVTSPLWAFRYSPLRVPVEAMKNRRKRKLDEEWRRNSTVAASLSTKETTESGEHSLWAFTPSWSDARKSRSGKRRK